ncbi:MAG: hypothetical protein A2249_01280 [Candidatus Jacksonbacteria bacterium RIFOXYA2_FULL_44_7]|nr:MAG: hypothetical protein A2249_01280 [Candidatus Jacksonbacteria bacterium RIFOXYA2_FULL_44_7]
MGSLAQPARGPGLKSVENLVGNAGEQDHGQEHHGHQKQAATTLCAIVVHWPVSTLSSVETRLTGR